MTVESNHVIVIASLSVWLKDVAPVVQPLRSKTNFVNVIFHTL